MPKLLLSLRIFQDASLNILLKNIDINCCCFNVHAFYFPGNLNSLYFQQFDCQTFAYTLKYNKMNKFTTKSFAFASISWLYTNTLCNVYLIPVYICSSLWPILLASFSEQGPVYRLFTEIIKQHTNTTLFCRLQINLLVIPIYLC